MRMSDGLALHLSPLFFRVLLAVIFIGAGLPKFETITFKGESAKILIDLGVATAPPPPAPSPAEEAVDPTEEAESGDTGDGDEESVPSEMPGEDTEEPGEGSVDETANGSMEDSDDDQPVTVEESTEVAAEPVSADDISALEVEARRMHFITVNLHKKGHPMPRYMAWLAAFTEVGGAALLLVGLFSRVWAMGLAITMVYAFWLTTWPLYSAALTAQGGWFPLGWWDALRGMGADDQPQKCFYQIALGLIALSVFFSGPGAFSIDRLIFRRRSSGTKLISEMDDE